MWYAPVLRAPKPCAADMSHETISIALDPRGVATVTLNRPEKHNALSAQMLAELTQAAADLGADKSVRVVVLTGAGKSFCAGGDLEWMRAQMQAGRRDTGARGGQARVYASGAQHTGQAADRCSAGQTPLVAGWEWHRCVMWPSVLITSKWG